MLSAHPHCIRLLSKHRTDEWLEYYAGPSITYIKGQVTSPHRGPVFSSESCAIISETVFDQGGIDTDTEPKNDPAQRR